MQSHNFRWMLLALASVIAAAGCKGASATRESDTHTGYHVVKPQDAHGETPIRAISCDAKGTDCNVVARFTDMAACEYHRRFARAMRFEDARPDRVRHNLRVYIHHELLSSRELSGPPTQRAPVLVRV
jgi:hypothetical protein